MAGAVGSATWLMARAVMRGDLASLPPRHEKVRITPRTKADIAKMQGNVASEKGLGRDIIVDFLWSQVRFVQIPAKASSGRHDRRRTSVLPWKKGKIAWAILPRKRALNAVTR
jgi:hypothetical protein